MSTDAALDVTLARNATVLATVDETTFLVDPLFAEEGALPPIDDTPNDRNNPLVPMPDVDLSHDAVVVTH
ncbi:MBL fold metallo-hydrolase, partial [Halorubrum sp. SP9]